jgi:heat shock protein HspQ
MASGGKFLRWLKMSLLGEQRRRESSKKIHAIEKPVIRSPRYGGYGKIMPTYAKFHIGDVVHHKHYPFRGVIFDVDPQFANTEEWYESIPEEVRPRKDQPFYHLFAENDRTHYVAYVSEQNLDLDTTNAPLTHPDIDEWFDRVSAGKYALKKGVAN